LAQPAFKRLDSLQPKLDARWAVSMSLICHFVLWKLYAEPSYVVPISINLA